jgi:hypothetical protein
MKYKVGDKVRVREDLKLNGWYKMENGKYKDTFVGKMERLRGKVVTIKSAKDKYRIEESDYNWTDEMFAGLAYKFKVGDEVVGNEKANRYGITKQGWKGIVKQVGPNGRIKVDCFIDLDPECFDLVSESKTVHIFVRGSETIAVLKDGKKEIRRAVAKCNPGDEFDFETGAKLAFERLFEEEKKPEYEIGQLVKILPDGPIGHGLAVGSTATIFKKRGDNRYWLKGFDGGGDIIEQILHISQFEPFKGEE